MTEEEQKLEKDLIKCMSPHIARTLRKLNGYTIGDLKCERCGSESASRNRQRTAYHDSDNMATYCPICQEEADEYWDEQWADYYSCIRC